MSKKPKTKEERFRLVEKLLTECFNKDEFELDHGSCTAFVHADMVCTARLCQIIAIAKRTGANCYKRGDTIKLYTVDHINETTQHYLRWADQQIKTKIEGFDND